MALFPVAVPVLKAIITTVELKIRERSFLFELCVRERTLLIAEVEKLDFILLETEAELTLPLCPTRSSSTILDAGKLELKAFTDPV